MPSLPKHIDIKAVSRK